MRVLVVQADNLPLSRGLVTFLELKGGRSILQEQLSRGGPQVHMGFGTVARNLNAALTGPG
jgi:hypothetical protein